MSYDWRYALPGDAAALRIRSWDTAGLAMQPLFDQLLPAYTHVFTSLYEGVPYSVAGGYYSAPGVMDIFIMTDKEVRRHARALIQDCLRGLEIMEDEGARRIQAAVPVGLAPSCRILEILGFQVEAILEAYYPDCDAYLFGRVRKR